MKLRKLFIFILFIFSLFLVASCEFPETKKDDPDNSGSTDVVDKSLTKEDFLKVINKPMNNCTIDYTISSVDEIVKGTAKINSVLDNVGNIVSFKMEQTTIFNNESFTAYLELKDGVLYTIMETAEGYVGETIDEIDLSIINLADQLKDLNDEIKKFEFDDQKQMYKLTISLTAETEEVNIIIYAKVVKGQLTHLELESDDNNMVYDYSNIGTTKVTIPSYTVVENGGNTSFDKYFGYTNYTVEVKSYINDELQMQSILQIDYELEDGEIKSFKVKTEINGSISYITLKDGKFYTIVSENGLWKGTETDTPDINIFENILDGVELDKATFTPMATGDVYTVSHNGAPIKIVVVGDYITSIEIEGINSKDVCTFQNYGTTSVVVPSFDATVEDKIEVEPNYTVSYIITYEGSKETYKAEVMEFDVNTMTIKVHYTENGVDYYLFSEGGSLYLLYKEENADNWTKTDDMSKVDMDMLSGLITLSETLNDLFLKSTYSEENKYYILEQDEGYYIFKFNNGKLFEATSVDNGKIIEIYYTNYGTTSFNFPEYEE